MPITSACSGISRGIMFVSPERRKSGVRSQESEGECGTGARRAGFIPTSDFRLPTSFFERRTAYHHSARFALARERAAYDAALVFAHALGQRVGREPLGAVYLEALLDARERVRSERRPEDDLDLSHAAQRTDEGELDRVYFEPRLLAQLEIDSVE